MNMIKIKEDFIAEIEDIVSLYEDVGGMDIQKIKPDLKMLLIIPWSY